MGGVGLWVWGLRLVLRRSCACFEERVVPRVTDARQADAGQAQELKGCRGLGIFSGFWPTGNMAYEGWFVTRACSAQLIQDVANAKRENAKGTKG